MMRNRPLGKYRLDGSPYEDSTEGLLEWARDLEDFKGRVVQQDLLWNGLFVSTVWLGLDHNFRGGPPLIFETMIFDHLNTGEGFYQERYSSLDDARFGHLWCVHEHKGFFATVRRLFKEAMTIEEDFE